jgi:helicase MOV-10
MTVLDVFSLSIFSEIFNKNIEKNLEQFVAVRNIVGNTAFPLPYIIYGPPGTGKTTTMVEAILQIYAQPTSSILVAATTNSACDTITSQLLEYIDSGLLRLYGELVMRDIDSLDEKVRAVSNIQDGVHRFPGEKDLRRFRIIVATVGTCGRLLQADLEEDYFTHIFIDECGSVREPSAMIPICKLKCRNLIEW